MDQDENQLTQEPAKPKFWAHAEMEIRTSIAYDLLKQTGLPQGADPGDLVTRAFQVADLFVDAAVSRGELREPVKNTVPVAPAEEKPRRGRRRRF